MATSEAESPRRELPPHLPALGFDSRTPFTVLDREHQRLRAALGELRAAFVPESPRRATPELVAQVDAVRASLAAHFAFEENFGSLHYLVAARPDLEYRLGELREEHRRALAAFDHMRNCLSGGLSLVDVGATLSALLEALAEHALEHQHLVRRALLGPASPRSSSRAA